MTLKRGMIFLTLIFLSSVFVSAQNFFDYGGTGFIAGLCDRWGDIFEFFVLFIVFFVASRWAVGHRQKGDVLSVAVALALSFGLVRWESLRGFSLVCGLGDTLGSVFGGFLGFILLLVLLFAFFALAK